MEIGETVIWRGRSWRVRGFDPASVQPQCVYLEDVESGERVTITHERLNTDSVGRSRRHLHLVDPQAHEPERPDA